MTKNRFIAVLTLALCLLAAPGVQAKTAELPVIPQPNKVEMGEGKFIVPESFSLFVNMAKDEKKAMVDYLKASPIRVTEKKKPAKKNYLHLTALTAMGTEAPAEAYTLWVEPNGISITGGSDAGVFYAVQTLLQLVEHYGKEIPVMKIEDEPRFGYRGMHLDISRHYSDKEWVKKQLDMMARYKFNTMHFHFTDNEGWRLEVPGYPRLTEFGAWRETKNWFEWSRDKKNRMGFVEKGTPGGYGGYYTRADMEEVVAYAKKLHINVIPEVEMPGHSWALLAAYPEFSCLGKPYTSDDVCIGNEDVFKFFEYVLTYVMEIFPSEYIHIGGDEADKHTWKECPKCQARMKAEGLKDVDELQSYMIRRMQKFLSAHGRHLIGWDEIHQGGLAPDAIVMSWRGEAGGIEAAKKGHHAIMTPDSHMYLDAYQDAPTTQPVAMAGFLPFEKVYSYNPIPDDFTPEQAAMILGAQGNTWGERMPDDNHKEYMIYPRMFAVSEVNWTQPENKDYKAFREKTYRNIDYIKSKGYNSFDLKNEIGTRPESLTPIKHLANGATVRYINTTLFGKYDLGPQALVDGVRGGWNYADGRWAGSLNRDMEFEIDLGKVTDIKEVYATFMQERTAGIFMPGLVEISISDDGKEFRKIASIESKWSPDVHERIMENIGWKGSEKTRYIRLKANVIRKPISHYRAGRFIFLDEIVVQ